MNRLARSIATIAVLAVVLAACGGGSHSTSAQSSSTDPADSTSTSSSGTCDLSSSTESLDFSHIVMNATLTTSDGHHIDFSFDETRPHSAEWATFSDGAFSVVPLPDDNRSLTIKGTAPRSGEDCPVVKTADVVASIANPDTVDYSKDNSTTCSASIDDLEATQFGGSFHCSGLAPTVGSARGDISGTWTASK
jgi:hypothetical protein